METKGLPRLGRAVSEGLEARVTEACGSAKDKKRLSKLSSETDCEQRQDRITAGGKLCPVNRGLKCLPDY